MSNQGAVAVPDYLKKYLASPNDPSQVDAESLATSSMSVPRISLKAKKFRWIEDGQEIKAEPETHVVILGVEPGPGKFVKTYYDGPYNPGDTSPPTCSSSDGIRPDSWVTTPQNELCATCRHNVFGSGTSRTGKKAKACRDSKRLWVASPDAIDGTVFGLGVPVTSLKNLSELGVTIKSSGLPIAAAVIKLSMEDDESYPIIKFEHAGWLNEAYGPLAIERNTKKDWPGALKESNPPVNPAIVNKSSGPPAAIQAPVQQRINDDGSIEGQASQAKGAPNVNDALKTWG